jgi:Ser/Thr protein kinase RdoA (MazF antagonist)
MKIAPDDQLVIDQVKLEIILDQYDLRLVNFTEASSGIENKTVMTDTNRGKYVVRIYRNGKKSDRSIDMELDFMAYLHSHSVPVPGVLCNQSSSYITKLTFDGRKWQIIVMEYIEGEHAKQYTEELISNMAKTQAAMHSLSAAYPVKGIPAEKLNVLKEEYFIKQIDLHHLKDDRLRGFLERASAYRLDLDVNLSRGLCHLDYDTDNVLAKDSSVLAVLDFDDLAIAPFIVCLAYTLWHIYTEKNEAAAWQYLENYETFRQLSDLERSHIKPIMLFRHYMISAIKVLNNHTLLADIDKYLDVETQLTV